MVGLVPSEQAATTPPAVSAPAAPVMAVFGSIVAVAPAISQTTVQRAIGGVRSRLAIFGHPAKCLDLRLLGGQGGLGLIGCNVGGGRAIVGGG